MDASRVHDRQRAPIASLRWMAVPRSHHAAVQRVVTYSDLIQYIFGFLPSDNLAVAAPTSRLFAQVVRRPVLWRYLILAAVSSMTVKELIRRAGAALESVSLIDVCAPAWDPLTSLGGQPRLTALDLRHCSLRLTLVGFQSFCRRRSRSRAACLPFALRSWLPRTKCFNGWWSSWFGCLGTAVLAGMPISVQGRSLPGSAMAHDGCSVVPRCVEAGCRSLSGPLARVQRLPSVSVSGPRPPFVIAAAVEPASSMLLSPGQLLQQVWPCL